MKMKNTLFALCVAILTPLLFNSCDEGDAVVDDVTANVTRGAILRTVNVISNEIPLGTPDAQFAVELEVQDEENGALVNSVEVYVGFRDNTVETGATDLDKEEILVTTLDVASFSVGEFGFPRTMYSISAPDLLSTLSLSEDDLDGGDQFTIRFELVLKDGRRFSFAQNSGTLTGSFFSSPFLYTPTVTCPVAATQFAGDYLITQTTPEVDGPTLSTGTVVTLEVGETSTQRIFQTANYPLYCAALRPFTIDLVCGEVVVPNQNSGCACSSGGDWFTDPEVRASYDPSDDSVFEVTFTDDAQSDCASPAQTTYSFTKQ